MGSIEMSKSLKEILSTPIKDTTVSEIRLQVVVGLPLPLIFINKLFFVHLELYLYLILQYLNLEYFQVI